MAFAAQGGSVPVVQAMKMGNGLIISNKPKEEKDQSYIKRIIAEDNLELLQNEMVKSIEKTVTENFFEVTDVKIPILHYCIMKKAMRCFKFLILNGADPFEKLMDIVPYSDWDCMSIAVCLGEWEMMKILEERGMNKLNNPSVWEAAALTNRNNLLEIFISNKDNIRLPAKSKIR